MYLEGKALDYWGNMSCEGVFTFKMYYVRKDVSVFGFGK